MSTLLFDENFTSDNSPTGQTAPTIAQLAARGWKDGVNNVGKGYKFELDPVLNKNVLFAHWATKTSGTGDIKQPDGEASAIKHFFPTTREATMYAMVKFHNVQNSPDGAHWVRFFNNPAFQESTPTNIDGQMDLDVTGSLAGGEGQPNWLYDPNTKHALPNPATQYNGFVFNAGNTLSFATPGKDNLWKDDIWYEVVWYLKPSTSGNLPTQASNGQMMVYVRPVGTAPWTTAFVGQNFVNTLMPNAPINAWMIGPYMTRWTNDIRHYFSRIAVWNGDAFSDGTLAAFLGNTPPPPPPPPPAPDTTLPVVTITSPVNGASVLAGQALNVVFTVSDNVGVVSSGLRIGTTPVTSPIVFPSAGTVVVTAFAKDAAGNEGTANVTVTVVPVIVPPPPPPPPVILPSWQVTSQSDVKIILEKI